MSTVKVQIAERAKKLKGEALHSLYDLIEDKVLQASVQKVIEPIYEEEFKPFSYDFRPGCSQHQAINCMFKHVSLHRMRDIIDADLKDYFGSINHGILWKFLEKRVKDGVIRRAIDNVIQHYSYYGITFNYRGIFSYYRNVRRCLSKWLNRRGGKPK
ncbi:reverse transcriptase domain-containing protein [Mariniphaga anaerophila]|nr:reverse transcriptase domain-containing protein [Mariniphaga anaerophila]